MPENNEQCSSPEVKKSMTLRHKLIFPLLILFFAFPNVVLIWMHMTGARPNADLSNRGTLVMPQVPLAIEESYGLNGKWALITLEPSDCPKRCMENLFSLQQIRRATGVDRARVHRLVFLLDSQNTDEFSKKLENFQGTLMLEGSKEALKTLSDITPLEAGTLYLRDPRGDIMMYYAPQSDYKDVLHDLERLLDLSKIG